jgi:SAM-dependent methyltransferase
MSTRYDTIGVGYAQQRRADPRIAAYIHAGLAGAERVVNVGAGAGSYEPSSTIVAVEPSTVMLEQRPRGTAPAVQASAEALPLADGCGDAGLASFTIHHWADPARGLDELLRVAPDRTVVLTWDETVMGRLWLYADYLPEVTAMQSGMPKAAETTALLRARGRRVIEQVVPIPDDCTDSFGATHWRSPERYLDPVVLASSSDFALLGPEVLRVGIDRLRADLDSGAWHERHRDLLARDELDVGCRLLVATPA